MSYPIVKGTTFASGQQVTATNLNNLVDQATFDSDVVDNVTLQVSSDQLSVKDGGITASKLNSGIVLGLTNVAGSSSDIMPIGDASDSFNIKRIAITELYDGAGCFPGQLTFPAVQNASANPNTLDDYEEGTWTPSLGGSATYTTQTGTYTKIGRLVSIHCRLVVNSIGTGSTFQITGLPFAANYQMPICVGYWAGAGVNSYSVQGYITSSTVDITVVKTLGAAVSGSEPFFTSGTDIMFSATYHV